RMEEKKVTSLPVMTLPPDASIQGELAEILTQVCTRNELNKLKIGKIATVYTPYLDNIIKMLELFLVLPCTIQIIEAIMKQGKHANEISDALVRLNEKIDLTISFVLSPAKLKKQIKQTTNFILSIVMVGRFASAVVDAFLG